MTRASHEEIVDKAFESFQHLNLDGFTSDWHADVVWDVSGYDGWPGSKTSYTGAPEILQEFGGFMSTVTGLQVTNLEVTPLDGNRVLATYHQKAREAADAKR